MTPDDAFVLDASAVLALLNREHGAHIVAAALPNSAISAVNLAEVASRLMLKGIPEKDVNRIVARLDLDVRPFDATAAIRSSALIVTTQADGLSLGDRACLDLALYLGRPALTADRAWLRQDLGIEVRLIR